MLTKHQTRNWEMNYSYDLPSRPIAEISHKRSQVMPTQGSHHIFYIIALSCLCVWDILVMPKHRQLSGYIMYIRSTNSCNNKGLIYKHISSMCKRPKITLSGLTRTPSHEEYCICSEAIDEVDLSSHSPQNTKYITKTLSTIWHIRG